MNIVWLGLRLSVGSGRRGLLRTVLMSAGAALGTLVVLACLASVSVAGAQAERARDRSPVYAGRADGSDSATDGGWATPEDLAAVAADVPVMRLIEIDDAIGHTPLRRIAVGGATAASPRPPGLARFPQPGEVVVSPALAELIRTDERARERFPQTVVGTIGRAGLVAPNELRAYVGVPADDPGLAGQRPLTGFGGPLRYTFGDEMNDPDSFSAGRFAAFAFALFVLVPFGVFLATCARLSASTRDRRIAALRLLGVPARQTAVVNAIETGVVAAGGALLGAVVFLALAPRSTGWPVGRLQWYAADASVPVTGIGTVLVVAVLYAVAVGVLASRSARVAPLAVRRDAPARRPGTWRVLPVLLGMAGAAVAARDTGLGPDARAALFGTAVVVVGIGLALALPVLGYGMAALVRRLPGTPVWLELAGARMRHSPGVAPRLVASITVAIYVAGLGSLGIGLVAADRDVAMGGSVAGPTLVQLSAGTVELAPDLRRLDGVAVSVDAVLPVTVDGRQRYAMVAACADFLAMYALPPGQSCVDGEVYGLEHTGWAGDGPAPQAGTDIRLGDGTSVPVPDRTLRARPRFNVGTGSSLLFTRAAPVVAGQDLMENGGFLIAADARALELVARTVSARAPAGAVMGDLGGYRGLDNNMLVLILVVGLSVSFVLGIGSFAAAAVDRSMERRRDNATLVVVGTRPAIVTASETGFGAMPLVLGVALAVAATLAVGLSFAAAMEVPARLVLGDVEPILWLSAASLVVGMVLIAVPAWLTQRITAEQLRRP